MRDDMSKVLVESPRSGRGYAATQSGVRRQRRHRLDDDGDAVVTRIGMGQGKTKHFGEHLGPLYRYLRKQVDRPWSLVYGELCAALDRRSVVQAHLFQHIDDKVAIETTWRDGEVWVRTWRGLEPLAECRCDMYVHPRTGILLVNRARLQVRQARNRSKLMSRAIQPADRHSGLAGMAPDVQWHRCDGLWFEVQLGTLSRVGKDRDFDVLLKRMVDYGSGLLKERYGSDCRYAIFKRQLDAKTLRRHGLICEVTID